MENNIEQNILSRHKLEDINVKHHQSLKFNERVALIITNMTGTMVAVYIVVFIILAWIVWQSFFLENPFDPYPFAFLLFIGSIVQLPMMSLIMVGQNLQGRHSELRAEQEFKATASMYQDMEIVISHLQTQSRKIEELTTEIDKLKSNHR